MAHNHLTPMLHNRYLCSKQTAINEIKTWCKWTLKLVPVALIIGHAPELPMEKLGSINRSQILAGAICSMVFLDGMETLSNAIIKSSEWKAPELISSGKDKVSDWKGELEQRASTIFNK